MITRFLKRPSMLMTMLVILLVPSVYAEGPADITDVVRKSFKVGAGGTLTINMSHGNIEVTTRRGSEVYIEVETVVNADERAEAERILEDLKLTFQQQGNDVYVHSQQQRDRSDRWRRWAGMGRVKVRVRAQVPESYNVNFNSGAGNVVIQRIDGNVTGKTGAGNITVNTTSGAVIVHSGTGNIKVDGVGNRAQVNTGAGNVELADIRGEVIASTGAGNISAQITRQPRGNSNLNTGAGNVEVAIGGRVGFRVDATTAMGSASTDFPLRVEGQWMKKSFSGEVNGGGPMLVMRAGVGNVELRKQ